MRKAYSFCASIFHYAAKLCNRHFHRDPIRLAVAAMFESLEHRVFMSASSSSDALLKGTVVGTSGSWDNGPYTVSNAFDGNLSTVSVAASANGDWAGLNLGAQYTIAQIKFAPQAGWTSRMVGGVFQGSNSPTFASGVTTLFTIKSTPAAGVYTTASVTSTASFQYVRYVGPNGSYGDVADIQFYGTPTGSSSGSSGGGTTSTGTGTTSGSGSGSSSGSGTTTGSGSNSGSPTTPVGSTTWASTEALVASGTAPRAVMQILAPEPYVGIAVVVRALNSTLGSGSPVDSNYEWNFGDPSSQYNVLPGFNASHIYTSPGTYRITLTVTNDLNQVSTVSNTVWIGADNRKVIYVNASTGNDSNSGTSPNSPVKTAARADALVGNNTEILFARGQEFNLGAAFKLNYKNVLVGAYGTGANPIINDTLLAVGAVIFTTNSSAAMGVTVEDLTLTTLNGTDPTATDMPMGVMAGGTDTSVVGCTFDYVEYDINASAAPVGLTAIGNTSPIRGGLQGYFLWDEGTDTTAWGNAVNGSVHEHVIRTSGATELLIMDNSLGNYDGKGCIEIHVGSYAWIDSNSVTSGDIRVGPLGLWGEPIDTTSDCVVQNNSVYNSDIAVFPGAQHINIRNNIVHSSGGPMIDVRGQDGLGRQSMDIQILNNTGMSSASTGQFLDVESYTEGILLENNLLVQPTLATGGYSTAPVYVDASNLDSFTYINGNVWQEPQTIYKYAQGGINFVAPSLSINGYLTPSAWNAEPQVGTDYFSDTPISGIVPVGGIALSVDKPVQGVFSDVYGTTRPQNGAWSAGAVQN